MPTFNGELTFFCSTLSVYGSMIVQKSNLFNENALIYLVVTVKVKWGRENFPNIQVNTDEDPLVFKAQLFALTGVQPHRQKVMCKGVALKDDEWNFSLKDVCVSINVT